MSKAHGTAPAIALRDATPADVPVIVALIEAASHEPWSADLVDHVLADPANWGHVALSDGGRPVGAVLARAAADQAEILNLVVDPAERRRGIGTALLAEAVRVARQQNSAFIFLEVAVDNAAALALYGAAGFESVGRRPEYYRHSGDIRVDALIMQLDLITSRRQK